MSLDLYRRLLAEMGDYLLQVEFCNWGEPLLVKDINEMIRDAHERGISTLLSTNFSLRFDEAAAERLVRSGLSILGVSIDGARQESYEQYRVRGDLALVLRNCALVRDAKKRLQSATPRLVWEYHVFPFNTGEVEAARAMARQEDDGHRARVADESLLQLETIDPRHVEIEHETGGHIVVCRFTLQKLAGRCVGMDVEVRSAQHARQRGSHGLVVVHDVHDPATGRGLLHRLTFRES